MRRAAFSPTQFWEAHNIHVAEMTFFFNYTFDIQKTSLNYLMASVQKCAQPSLFKSANTTYIDAKYGKWIPACAHTRTRTHPHTYVGFCPGQDAGNASFCWHLLEGKSSLEAVVWHQHSKTDTIYHWPLSTETFITSWQENLVENNHWGFDNSLDASFTPHLDGVLPWFTIHYR